MTIVIPMSTTSPAPAPRQYLAAAFAGLTITPAPASADPDKWRVSGTHRIDHADGRIEVCGCGPANHLTGPRWAVVRGVEVMTPTRDA